MCICFSHILSYLEGAWLVWPFLVKLDLSQAAAQGPGGGRCQGPGAHTAPSELGDREPVGGVQCLYHLRVWPPPDTQFLSGLSLRSGQIGNGWRARIQVKVLGPRYRGKEAGEAQAGECPSSLERLTAPPCSPNPP